MEDETGVLLSSRELADREFEDPPFLIKPMIPLGGTAILHGPPNVGKTQFVLTLANAINEGRDFLGKWPVEQGPVVVIQADMTPQIQQLRVRKIVGEADIEDTYWTFPHSMDITKLRLKHRRMIQEIKKVDPVVIVWDTLRKIHRLPENASETPREVFLAAQDAFPRATHLFLHHDRKLGRDPQLEERPGEAFRGAGGWKGDSDTTLQLRPATDGLEPKRIVLRFHKARTAPEHQKAPMVLELDPRTLLFRPVRPGVGGRNARAEAARRNFLSTGA